MSVLKVFIAVPDQLPLLQLYLLILRLYHCIIHRRLQKPVLKTNPISIF